MKKVTSPQISDQNKEVVPEKREKAQKRTYMVRGFLSVTPLWLATIPSGIAFTLLARAGHFQPLETLLFALSTFSGSAQAATITLFVSNTNLVVILITVLLINVRNTLYGVSLGVKIGPQSQLMRCIQAFFLTDASYSFTIANRDEAEPEEQAYFFLGAGISQYFCYSLAVAIGVSLGLLLPPDTNKLGLNFIFPLMFLSFLVSSLKTWRQVIVAGMAIVVMIVCQLASLGSFDIVLATLAALVGVVLEGNKSPQPKEELAHEDVQEARDSRR